MTTLFVPSTTARPTSRRCLVRAGALATAAAVVATVLVAAVARAAGVSFEVDGKAIPLAAFGQLTIAGGLIGIGLAAVLRHRRRFLAVTVVATALSVVPSLAAPDAAATSAVLVLEHVVAAAVIIPVLALRLPAEGRS